LDGPPQNYTGVYVSQVYQSLRMSGMLEKSNRMGGAENRRRPETLFCQSNEITGRNPARSRI
jgi:hypothetical protein